jgi:hypothetical protein
MSDDSKVFLGIIGIAIFFAWRRQRTAVAVGAAGAAGNQVVSMSKGAGSPWRSAGNSGNSLRMSNCGGGCD